MGTRTLMSCLAMCWGSMYPEYMFSVSLEASSDRERMSICGV